MLKYVPQLPKSTFADTERKIHKKNFLKRQQNIYVYPFPSSKRFFARFVLIFVLKILFLQFWEKFKCIFRLKHQILTLDLYITVNRKYRPLLWVQVKIFWQKGTQLWRRAVWVVSLCVCNLKHAHEFLK